MAKDSRLLEPDTAETIDYLGLFAAIAAISSVGVALGLSMPLLSLVMEDRGASTTLIGSNAALAGIASLLTAPFVPRLTKTIGTVRLAVLAVLTMSISFVAFYLVTPIWAWFPLRFIFSCAVNAIFIVSEFWINAVAPDRRRGFIIGIYAMILSAGFAAGPALLSLVGSAGFLPFAIGAVVFALGGLPVLVGRNNAPEIPAGDSAPFLPFLIAVPMATGAAFVFGSAESAGFSMFALYGEGIGLSEPAAVSLVTLVAAGGFVFLLPIGLIADRFNRRMILLICAIAGIAGSLLIPAAGTDMRLLAPLLMVFGGLTAGLYTVGLTHLGSRYRGADLASANAAFVFMYALGMLVGPATAGYAMDRLGTQGLPLALTAFFVFYLALALWRMVVRRT